MSDTPDTDENATADVARDLLRAFGGRGHDVVMPDPWSAGVVFASPHSGMVYPDSLLRASPLTRRELRRNEDALVDRLFACAPELGAPLLRARFPRCFVDVNRAGDDLPPEWRPERQAGNGCVEAGGPDLSGTSAYRARMGLGVVPLIISENLAIYRHPPSRLEAAARLCALYHPYHRALRELLDRALARFGEALLIDCHSMPGYAAEVRGSRTRPSRRADIVLGDAHGKAARPEHMEAVHEAFARRGYRVVRNHPYAGGYATLHYGQPSRGVGAIQIEINRDLYLNPVTLAPKAGYDDLARDMRGVVAEVVAALRPGLAIAAE